MKKGISRPNTHLAQEAETVDQKISAKCPSTKYIIISYSISCTYSFTTSLFISFFRVRQMPLSNQLCLQNSIVFRPMSRQEPMSSQNPFVPQSLQADESTIVFRPILVVITAQDMNIKLRSTQFQYCSSYVKSFAITYLGPKLGRYPKMNRNTNIEHMQYISIIMTLQRN